MVNNIISPNKNDAPTVPQNNPTVPPEDSEDSSSCPVCQEKADKVCSGCNSISYCSSQHQKAHWKSHKESCRPFILKRNELYGRYVIAARDLAQGTIVMTEGPLIIGPTRITYPICLGCHKRVDGTYRCSRCTFPVCSELCENKPIHADLECRIFQRGHPVGSRIKDFTSIHPAYEAVLPLRCLLLRDREPVKWTKLNSMEHHNDIRREEAATWNQNQNNTVKLLREWYKLKDDFDEETINTVIGFVDVNCFEIKAKDIEICGIYPEASLMCHDCVPNTHHATTTDQGYRMIIRTSVPVRKGEMITTSYVNHLRGTPERRDILKQTKYFDCFCRRCQDPTEFGSFLSGIKCLHCPPGYSVPTPLENGKITDKKREGQGSLPWICFGCKASMSYEKAQGILNKVRKEIELAEGSTSGSRISRLEKVLKKFSGKVLHPNNHLLLDLVKTLYRLYLPEDPLSEDKTKELYSLDRELLLRKRELCLQFLGVLDVVDPGLTRHRGVTLYQLYRAELPLFKLQLDCKELTKEEFKEKLNSILAYLTTTKQTLELDRLVTAQPITALAVDVAFDEVHAALFGCK